MSILHRRQFINARNAARAAAPKRAPRAKAAPDSSKGKRARK